VPVAFRKVKFCRVVEPVSARFEAVKPAKALAPLQVFESASSVEEAKVQVVVEKEYKRPVASAATPPCESEERRRSLVNVEDAVERRPFVNATVVEVETP
jgi:hypothetical protein